ncbi:MAG: DinB family protein [Blastocatellia bacterium]
MSAPASHLDPFIANWNRVHNQSTKIMKAAPNDKYDWKPADTAMPLGELMNHLYVAESLFIDSAMTGGFKGEDLPKPINDTDELIAAFDKLHQEGVAKIASLTPEQMNEIVAPFGPDKAMPRSFLMNVMLEHEIHHRGQLYTYLRILGCECPALFG